MKKMACFPKILSAQKFPGRYWRTAADLGLQGNGTNPRDYSFPSKKSEPLYFPSSNATRIQIHFHLDPKHN